MTREQLAAVWLDWVNNYLTIGGYADANGLHDQEAADLLNVARRCHENPHPEA